jgi:hypothetical protein
LEVLNGGAISDPGVGPTPSPPTPSPPAPSPPAPSPPAPSPPPPGNCGSDEIFVEIKITTDRKAVETYLELTRSDGAALVTGSNLANNQRYGAQGCLPANDCYTFTITDSEDNGICCGYGQGSFEVNTQGQTVGGGGEFGSKDIFSFGQCDSPSIDLGVVKYTPDSGKLQIGGP